MMDSDNGQITITISNVTQNETNMVSDINTRPDAIIKGDEALLHAGRAGDGNAQVMKITFIADDR
jgi:hypothetical protein